MPIQINIDLGSSPESEQVADNIREYANLSNMSLKRLFMLGVADYIASRGDNPELVLSIIDYLQIDKRKRGQR
jgi:hypothetical protein